MPSPINEGAFFALRLHRQEASKQVRLSRKIEGET
nr:MAG TPA: hypothetical protein [Caudoviricetes sp.]